MRLLRFARYNHTVACHCEEQSDEAISEGHMAMQILVLKPLPSPGGKWSMEDVNSLYLSNMIIIDIKKDNLFLYLHFSEKGIYSAVNQRMTTEKEQGRPEDRASG
jgi:hypothetical protein